MLVATQGRAERVGQVLVTCLPSSAAHALQPPLILHTHHAFNRIERSTISIPKNRLHPRHLLSKLLIVAGTARRNRYTRQRRGAGTEAGRHDDGWAAVYAHR